MVAIRLKKGEHLVRKGETTKAIYIVLQGAVSLQSKYNHITLGSGSVLGFILGVTEEYICDYIAAEDSLIASYKYETPEDYKTIFKEQPKYCYAFLHAIMKQYRMLCERYGTLKNNVGKLYNFISMQNAYYEMNCSQNFFEEKEAKIETLTQLLLPEPIQKWEMGYFNQLSEIPEKTLHYVYGENEDLTIGILLQTAEMMTRMISNMDVLKEYLYRAKEYLLCEEEDLLELWYDLAVKFAEKGKDIRVVDAKVKELEQFLKSTGFYKEEEISARMQFYYSVDFRERVRKQENNKGEEAQGEVAEFMNRQQVLRTDFATYIMQYAGYEKEEIVKCKKLIREYSEIATIQDYTPEMQQVRKALTKMFYEIYERAFLRAVQAKSISIIMKLFFNFGVLDLAMAGVKHLDELMAICELLDNQEEKQKQQEGENICHVYTIYQWLCMVYRGEKEPSKNEFDVDYAGDLLEMRKRKEITHEEENRLKHDQLKKVQFEIRNMFMTNNRITYGRITTFCPVLHEKDFIRSIDQLLVSFASVNQIVNDLRELDYTCFYREVLFTDPKHGIERTEIMKEVLPDVILMPNIGTKAMMWQETAGVRRDTPARFIFPVMATGNMQDMMLETMGRYRWEICRKILGVRWNDIREKSLTSEFYDYIQFYRKNRDLSPQAKDKIKAELIHAKNNYREVFVEDYVNWMKYESQGSFRLNKVARKIIADYVPFKREICRKLEINPFFKDLFAKRSAFAGKRWERERALFERYTQAGGVMTPELEAHMRYFEM